MNLKLDVQKWYDNPMQIINFCNKRAQNILLVEVNDLTDRTRDKTDRTRDKTDRIEIKRIELEI